MLKNSRTKVTGTIGDFVDTLVAGQSNGTEQEKVYKALAIMEDNGLISSADVSRFKDEYANGDYIVNRTYDTKEQK